MYYIDINSPETIANYKAFAKEHNAKGYDIDGKRIPGYKWLDVKHKDIFGKILYIFIKRQFYKNSKKIFSKSPNAIIGYWDIQNLLGEKVGLSSRTVYNRFKRMVEVGILKFAVQAKKGLHIEISDNIISYKKLSETNFKTLKKERFLSKTSNSNSNTKIEQNPQEDIKTYQNTQDLQCSIKDYEKKIINNKENKKVFFQSKNYLKKNKKVAKQPNHNPTEHPPNNQTKISFKERIDNLFKSSDNNIFTKTLKISVLAIYFKIINEIFTTKAENYNIKTAPAQYQEFIIESLNYLVNYPAYFGTCKNEKNIKAAETRLIWSVEAVKKHLKKNNKNLDLAHPNKYLKPTNNNGFTPVVTDWWRNSNRKFSEWKSTKRKTQNKIDKKVNVMIKNNKLSQILLFLIRVQGNQEMQNKAFEFVAKNFPDSLNNFEKDFNKIKNRDKKILENLKKTQLNDKFLKSVFGDFEGIITVGDVYFDEILNKIASKIRKMPILERTKTEKKLKKYANKNGFIWKTKNNSLKFYRAFKRISDKLYKIY